MKVWGALIVMLMVSACSSDAPNILDRGASAEPTTSRVPVPGGLESGCPPEDTPLRYPDGDLPSGAIAVRLCPGAPTIGYDGARIGPHVQGPGNELTTGISPLIDLVNGLPEFQPDTACHLDAGANLAYWFRYPDGDARAVSYYEGGCHTLAVDEDLGRLEGERLASAFANAIATQRAQSDAPPPQSDAPSCPLPPMSEPTSVLPSTPFAMTHATWCRVVGPYRQRAAAIPAPLLQRINQTLLGEPTKERDRCPSPAYVQTIEGINQWGDRVSYLVSGCRVVARTGYGRDRITTTYESDPDVITELAALRLGPVERWEREG